MQANVVSIIIVFFVGLRASPWLFELDEENEKEVFESAA